MPVMGERVLALHRAEGDLDFLRHAGEKAGQDAASDLVWISAQQALEVVRIERTAAPRNWMAGL